jgi:hypothetical protein
MPKQPAEMPGQMECVQSPTTFGVNHFQKLEEAEMKADPAQ